MPFVDKSTLTYPATNAFPVRKWLDQSRDPVSGVNGDYKNFQIFDLWINESTPTAWIMVDRTVNSGTWIQMASTGTGILTLTGDVGGAVGPDGASNVNLLSSTNLTITGNPGTNTLTVSLDGSVSDQFDTDAGTAIPAAGILNILGTGGLSTSGAGNTVTVTAGGAIPTSFVTDAGTATPALNILNVLGGTSLDTAGAGDTVTINAGGDLANTYTCDVGSATPAANNLNVVGSGSSSTSGAGSTVTITSTGGGLDWIEIIVVGPTSLVADTGYVTNNAATVELLLPLTCAFGSVLHVVNKGAGGWQINQNAGQQILVGSSSTTVGVGGNLNSSSVGDSIEFVCITADTTWRVYSSEGNLIIT